MHFAPEPRRRVQCVNDGRGAALWTHGHTVLMTMILTMEKMQMVKQVDETARVDTNHISCGVRDSFVLVVRLLQSGVAFAEQTFKHPQNGTRGGALT